MARSLWGECEEELELLKSKNLYRRLRSDSAILDFSSNDYLGLSQNTDVKKAAAASALAQGAGSGASRLISGNLEIHTRLEKKLASFKGEQAALTFSSGFLANLGVLTSILNEKDIVILDRLNHASLVDAARLSRAKLWVYPHRDISALERILQRSKGFRRKLVATDAYFSMDGDVAPLDKLLKICEKYGAILMIDEAHSTGVYGKTGTGLTEVFGLKGKVPIVMGTLSKALGSSGGYVAGGRLLKEILINRARSFIYTTAPVPAASAAALKSLEIIEKKPAMIADFWKKIKSFREKILSEGFDLMDSEGPVVPVLIGDPAKALKMQEFLSQEGIFVPAIRPPTVPKKTDRLRISLRATHTAQELSHLVSALKKAKEKNL